MMRNARFAAVTVVVALAFVACGRAVQVPVTQAFEKRRAQAEAGDAEAQDEYGMQLQLGIDASPDHRAAATWLRRAARHGHRESQLTLGMLYQNCDAESRDYVESVAWLRTAAESGYAPAMSSLADLYAIGRGVFKDPVLASMWHFLAAYRSSGRNRDQMVRMAELMARALTRVERREALRLAAEWDAAHPQ